MTAKTEITNYKYMNASEKVKLQILNTKQIPIYTLQRRKHKKLFNSKLYLQRDRLASISPTFANLFLSHLEEIWLNECPIEFKPQFYRRYIDD